MMEFSFVNNFRISRKRMRISRRVAEGFTSIQSDTSRRCQSRSGGPSTSIITCDGPDDFQSSRSGCTWSWGWGLDLHSTIELRSSSMVQMNSTRISRIAT